ncbi:MAG: flavodoxin [Conchiformibius sp.]|nr:flavodoxin [Conchiformibius sp.]
MAGWILGSVLLAVLAAAVAIVGTDAYQYRQNQKQIEQFAPAKANGKTLVVFFSRSGNTELMARKIAEIKQADVLPLQSARNRIGFIGWIQALQDARNTQADITPRQVDLSPYDTVYIGSPVWLYSPAPQIYEFARHNDFSGKKVILFNTMNSKFEPRYIDGFKKIIEQNGGSFVRHLYFVRGRMGQQADTAELLQHTEQMLKE